MQPPLSLAERRIFKWMKKICNEKFMDVKAFENSKTEYIQGYKKRNQI